MKKFVVTLFALLLFVPSAQAVNITASEYIVDAFDGDQRDFERTRVSSSGVNDFTGNDATIIAENALSNAFGVLSTTDVSYRHDLTWLTPPADSFASATLTIGALLPLGGNDQVYTETFSLGALNNGLLTSTVFSSNNSAILNILFADGYLDIFINKNEGANFLGSLNALTIYSSRLDVEYTPVPEPGTMALLGAGLLGGAIKRRRNRAAV